MISKHSKIAKTIIAFIVACANTFLVGRWLIAVGIHHSGEDPDALESSIKFNQPVLSDAAYRRKESRLIFFVMFSYGVLRAFLFDKEPADIYLEIGAIGGTMFLASTVWYSTSRIGASIAPPRWSSAQSIRILLWLVVSVCFLGMTSFALYKGTTIGTRLVTLLCSIQRQYGIIANNELPNRHA